MRLVTVATYDHPYQAHLAVAVLEDAGIPSRLSGEYLHGMSTFFSGRAGGVKVQVPEDRAGEARELLAAVESRDPRPPDEGVA
jgi:hypothetical protein